VVEHIYKKLIDWVELPGERLRRLEVLAKYSLRRIVVQGLGEEI
jgi:hypothetical protein